MLNLNFVIIGAQKSGSTALFAYLAQHPDLFMCPTKELGYFAYQSGKPNFRGPDDNIYTQDVVADWAEYCGAFHAAKPGQLIGEASVIYQYNINAVENLHSRFPAAKLIAVLRNPVYRAYSAYKHLLRDERESETFEDAIALEDTRIKNNFEPLWHYRRVGLYGEQLRRVFQFYPKEQVKVIFSEDLNTNTLETVRSCFRFLGVDSSFEPDVSFRPNRSGAHKSKAIGKFINKPNWLKNNLKKVIPLKLRWKMKAMLQSDYENRADSLPEALKNALHDYYREDVHLLEKLLERDLSHWLERPLQ